MAFARTVATLVLLAGGGARPSADVAAPPVPEAWVTDDAHLLAPATVARLDARLADVDRRTGHQLLVYVDRTTKGAPIEDWASRAFAAWRVGRRGIDDGAVLFVFTEDHRLRIEVGYGLEAVLPDARAARILDEIVAPQLRAGQPDQAVEAGVEAMLAAVGAPSAGGPAGLEPFWERPPTWVIVVGAGVGLAVLILLLVLATRHPLLALWLSRLVMRARSDGAGRGGGFGGGGGFRGGGGRSGGGGASGSW
ncbi:MAG TPA: TPM domain-containing protein [Polyangia bacterium]|nr:TPM domain-containing protein [Polyangia bacterium]